MNKTGISWTDLTWNPISGCSKVSPGCKNCYAEAWSKRWGRSFDVTLHPNKLKEVKKIPSGSKVFVNSMSDLFHEKVPATFVWDVIKAIESRPDVTFQILTKRPDRITDYTIALAKMHPDIEVKFPSNIWLGVSIEMPQYLKRIRELLFLDWAGLHKGVKFISFEPLLADIGKISFEVWDSRISWAIIGGESGPHHRPMKIEWAQNIAKQAKEQGVAVWMKQLGGLYPGGNIEDFPEDLRLREFPEASGECVKEDGL